MDSLHVVENDEPVILKRGRGEVCIYDGHQYYKNRKFPSGLCIWRCSTKRDGKFVCTGSLTIGINMDKGCKFYIVMFKDTNFPDYINQVQCVPYKWVDPKSDEPGFVKVSYPSCELEIDLVFKKADEFPSANWSFYKAKILNQAGTTKDASEKLSLVRSIIKDVLQNEIENPVSKMSKETESRKRKLEDLGSKNQPAPSTLKLLDNNIIDLDDSYTVPIMTGFQEVYEARTNALSEDEEEQNEGNISTVFKELRSRIMLTLHEIQAQMDPDYKSTECEIEINQDESEMNRFSLGNMGLNPDDLNFTAPGPNIVELMPDTGVYVQAVCLHHVEKLKEPKLIIANLLNNIFKDDSLLKQSILQLNQRALLVLYLFMLQKYNLNIEKTRDRVVKFLRSKRLSKNVKV